MVRKTVLFAVALALLLVDVEAVCTEWTPLTSDQCPTYSEIQDVWMDVDCVETMDVGDICEGDGYLPDGQDTTDLDNCDIYDMYMCTATSDTVVAECVGWTPLPASDCPSYNDLYDNWADVDCVAEMNLGDWCEGDGTLPDGQATSYLDNCDIYDMFVCSAMSDGSTMPEPTDEPTDVPTDDPTEDPEAECEDLDETGCNSRVDCDTRLRKNGAFKKCKDKRCRDLSESECEQTTRCKTKHRKNGEYKNCKKA